MNLADWQAIANQCVTGLLIVLAMYVLPIMDGMSRLWLWLLPESPTDAALRRMIARASVIDARIQTN